MLYIQTCPSTKTANANIYPEVSLMYTHVNLRPTLREGELFKQLPQHGSATVVRELSIMEKLQGKCAISKRNGDCVLS